MFKSVNIAVFCMGFVLPFTARGEAKPLVIGLDDAIAKALSSHSEIKIKNSERQRADLSSTALHGTLLPTVTLSRTMMQRQGPHAGKDAYNLLTVEERIANPYKLANSFKIANNNIEIAGAGARAKLAELRERVQLQYFKVVAAKVAVENAIKNLEIARQSVESGRKRYNGGFIHSSDANRIEVNYKIIESSLDEKKESYRDESVKLALLMGVEAGTIFENKTQIPTDFKYFVIAEREIDEKIKAPHSDELRQIQLELANSDLTVRNAETSFYPDLRLGASYIANSQNPDYVDYHREGPSFYLTAEWEIFNGGRNSTDYLNSVASKYETSERLRQFELDYNAEIERLVRSLYTQKKQYLIAKDNTVLTKSVFEASRERFNRGLIDSGRVSDDMQDYLDQEGKLLDISLKIIETVAALARATGKADLFNELI